VENFHPGKVLTQQFMSERGLSSYKLAACMHVGHSAIFEIVNERRGISAEMALRLAKFFKTKPEYWLELQNRYDLKCARKKLQMEEEDFDVTIFDTIEESELKTDWKEEMRKSNLGEGADLEICHKIYEKLGTEPVHFDQIAYDLGLEGGETAAFLTGLELNGWVKRLPADWYVRAK
jgi:addiction module HigA family antidote